MRDREDEKKQLLPTSFLHYPFFHYICMYLEKQNIFLHVTQLELLINKSRCIYGLKAKCCLKLILVAHFLYFHDILILSIQNKR